MKTETQESMFKLHAPYQPTGNQLQAIAKLVNLFKVINFKLYLGLTRGNEFATCM